MGATLAFDGLNTSTAVVKSSIWGTWLGPACASTGGYNTAFKNQTDIFIWQQVKMKLFWSLGQLMV